VGTEATNAVLQQIQSLLEAAAGPSERRPVIDARVESYGTEVFAVAAVPTQAAAGLARTLVDLAHATNAQRP
jgi:hypothetical protein